MSRISWRVRYHYCRVEINLAFSLQPSAFSLQPFFTPCAELAGVALNCRMPPMT